MPVSDAQKRASSKYDKEKMKRTTVVFSPNELDLYEYLSTKDSMSGYIKELIKRDMDEHK